MQHRSGVSRGARDTPWWSRESQRHISPQRHRKLRMRTKNTPEGGVTRQNCRGSQTALQIPFVTPPIMTRPPKTIERRFEKKALVTVDNEEPKREGLHGWKMVFKNEAQGTLLAQSFQLSLLSPLSLGVIQSQVSFYLLHDVTPWWPHLTWTWGDCLSRHRREDKLWGSRNEEPISPSAPQDPWKMHSILPHPWSPIHRAPSQAWMLSATSLGLNTT